MEFWSALTQEDDSHSDSSSESASEEAGDPIEGVATDLEQIVVSDDITTKDTSSDANFENTLRAKSAITDESEVSIDSTNQRPDTSHVIADTDVAPPIDHTPNRDTECVNITTPLLTERVEESVRLLSRNELIQQLLSISPVPDGHVTTVGMVRMYGML